MNLLIGLFIYLFSQLAYYINVLMYPNQPTAKTRNGRAAMSDKRYMYDKIRCLYSANVFKRRSCALRNFLHSIFPSSNWQLK